MREVLLKENEIEEGFLHLTGGRVWYRIVGTDKKKLPLLCVHGGPGVPHEYLTPLEMLADERPVILFDQLGCGNSDCPDNPSLWNADFFRKEIQEVREALALDEFFYFGHSWGTMVGADYLLHDADERVRAAVLSSPVMKSKILNDDCDELVNLLPSEDIQAIAKAKETENYHTAPFEKALDEFYHRHICRLNPWPDYVIEANRKTGFSVYEQMWGNCEFVCTGNLRPFDVTDEMDRFQMPILFTCGEFDECPPTTVSKYHMAVKNSKFAVIKGGSHFHFIENPQEFKEIVSGFLAQHE